MPDSVRHDADAHRFALATDAGDATLDYDLEDDGLIVFTHTVVPDAAQGRGVGTRLVEGALAHVRGHDLKVVPQCPFVAGYLRDHPDDQDLLAPRATLP